MSNQPTSCCLIWFHLISKTSQLGNVICCHLTASHLKWPHLLPSHLRLTSISSHLILNHLISSHSILCHFIFCDGVILLVGVCSWFTTFNLLSPDPKSSHNIFSHLIFSESIALPVGASGIMALTCLPHLFLCQQISLSFTSSHPRRGTWNKSSRQRGGGRHGHSKTVVYQSVCSTHHPCPLKDRIQAVNSWRNHNKDHLSPTNNST